MFTCIEIKFDTLNDVLLNVRIINMSALKKMSRYFNLMAERIQYCSKRHIYKNSKLYIYIYIIHSCEMVRTRFIAR